jgi:DNA-directed RNA polymerase subunit RPC12/RpoP
MVYQKISFKNRGIVVKMPMMVNGFRTITIDCAYCGTNFSTDDYSSESVDCPACGTIILMRTYRRKKDEYK